MDLPIQPKSKSLNTIATLRSGPFEQDRVAFGGNKLSDSFVSMDNLTTTNFTVPGTTVTNLGSYSYPTTSYYTSVSDVKSSLKG